jgi:hypothetical protein
MRFAGRPRTRALWQEYRRTPCWSSALQFMDLAADLERELLELNARLEAQRAIHWHQLVLLVFSGAAISASILLPPALAKWGCLVGLIGQPFWMYSTQQARQWGMHILAWWTTAVYAVGFAAR